MQEIQINNEAIEDTNEPLTKKKPRSEKQILAFKVAMEKRANNIASRKNEKLIVASEILVKNAKLPPVAPIETPMPKYKKVIQHESETESDEEIIIVKSNKKKKKVKKIIIEESSESDSSSDDGGQTPAQQSYVQRYAPQQQERIFNSANYFI